MVSEDNDIRNKFFRNMSKNACKMLIEDIEFFSPILMTDIKNAQDEILKIILELIRCGEIISPLD